MLLQKISLILSAKNICVHHAGSYFLYLHILEAPTVLYPLLQQLSVHPPSLDAGRAAFLTEAADKTRFHCMAAMLGLTHEGNGRVCFWVQAFDWVNDEEVAHGAAIRRLGLAWWKWRRTVGVVLAVRVVSIPLVLHVPVRPSHCPTIPRDAWWRPKNN